MSKKRKRDGTEVDADLVGIYDQLSDEDNFVRLRAAQKLLIRFDKPESMSAEEIRAVLTRLFRGLCSGRKAARLGFAVALTEILLRISTARYQISRAAISPAEIIDILESATAAEGNVSGQDERDHYIGRVFGAKAIVQSRVEADSLDRTQWQRLLDILLSVSRKKPWLRQECGWIMFEFANSERAQGKQGFVEDIIKAMKAHNLIRTPEGVAIWLAILKNYPKASLPSQCWKHKHPLDEKEINFLPQIMKDSPSGSIEGGHQSQGSGTWSPNLHFAWQVVLETLYQEPQPGLMSFADFWKAVVDEGLFRNTSSTERKSWGMLVWAMVLNDAPVQFLQSVFTKKALRCLITELHGDDRYLRKASQGVLEALKGRLKDDVREYPSDILGKCVTALITATGFADFDKLTKTNTLATLMDIGDLGFAEQWDTFAALTDLLSEEEDEEPGTAYPRWRYILDLQSKIVMACLKREGSAQTSGEVTFARQMVDTWLFFLSRSKHVPPDTRAFLIDRLAAAFEQALKYGRKGRTLLKDTMSSIKTTDSHYTRFPDFDDQVSAMVQASVESLKKLCEQEKEACKPDNETSSHTKTSPGLLDGLVLLYSVVLFEVFCGDTEAVEILQDLPENELSHLASGSLIHDTAARLCDTLVETLLGLASRSSKLLRAATTLIFESFAPQLSKEGISALARVLVSQENAKGQQEMFEAANWEESEEDDPGSESEDLDSDVEMVNGINHKDEAISPSSGESNSASEDDNSDEEEGKKSASEVDQAADDELAAFDAALASALGTRKPTEEDLDASSSSDSDMSDSQMLALDEKLAEVFRARKATASKKKDLKNTKENMVNFKNRVLDLVEVYLKQQVVNPLTLELVLPVLEAIRTTQSKQLADRLTSVLRDFCQRCKGANVPILPMKAASLVLDTLRAVHDEASLDTSNAHSAAASQASILLVKVLARADPSRIGNAVAIYSNTRTRQLMDKPCKVQPAFFTDWNNWCTTARNTLAT